MVQETVHHPLSHFKNKSSSFLLFIKKCLIMYTNHHHHPPPTFTVTFTWKKGTMKTSMEIYSNLMNLLFPSFSSLSLSHPSSLSTFFSKCLKCICKYRKFIKNFGHFCCSTDTTNKPFTTSLLSRSTYSSLWTCSAPPQVKHISGQKGN